MNQVVFTYRHWLFRYLKRKEAKLPESLLECTAKQLSQALLVRTYNESDPQKQLRLLRQWTGLSLPQLSSIAVEDLTALRKLLAFAVKPEALFDTSLIRSFRHRKRTYFAPADQLTNCTFVEFCHADSFVSTYAETKEVAYLLRALAVLFRPEISKRKQKSEGWNGDKRRGYQFDLAKEEAEYLANLRPEILEYFLLFFSGCKKYILQTFPQLFSPDEGGDIRPMSQDPWATAQKVLLKSKPGWTLDHIQQENLYNALDLLQDLKIEHQRELQRNKSLR